MPLNSIPCRSCSGIFSRLFCGYRDDLKNRIVEARAGIELEANHYLLHMSLGWYLAGQGRHDEAVDALRQATALAPGELMPLAALGGGLGRARAEAGSPYHPRRP